jgi:hypothetical protein
VLFRPILACVLCTVTDKATEDVMFHIIFNKTECLSHYIGIHLKFRTLDVII